MGDWVGVVVFLGGLVCGLVVLVGCGVGVSGFFGVLGVGGGVWVGVV